MKNRSLLASCLGTLTLAAVLAVAPASVQAGGEGAKSAISQSDVTPVCVSQDLSYVLTSNSFMRGMALVNTQTGEAVSVSTQANAAQYASISPDGKYVCYKGFEKAAGATLQVPMLYDIATGKQIALSAAAPLAGTPAVSANGKIAFTVGNKLLIQNAARKTLRSFDLGHHVNLLAFSADGKKIAYNDPNGQIAVLNVVSGARRVVTDAKACYWGPQFSPKADKLLLRTVDGKVAVTGAAKRAVRVLGEGESPAWVDNNNVAFVSRKKIETQEVLETQVVVADALGKAKKVAAAEAGDASIALAAGNVAVGKNGKLKYGYIKQGKAQLVDLAAAAPSGAGVTVDEAPAAATSGVVDYGSYVRIDGVPYLHQVYDTPDYWNGHSSCGVSSALMAIQYYNFLPTHPITVSYPSTHTSDYGWYVPEIYTFNGVTYNIPSKDPNNRTGYGGFGYITQNNWEDTKGHMAEYINYHGPSSSVDWAPTFTKAIGEVDVNTPFVVLNSLTSAGHYIVCIGYYKAQYTLIFNDPYGNKNTGVYPSLDGRNVPYDWPGYNNGFSNLNIVHCYIYCRHNALPPPPISSVTATNIWDTQATITWRTAASSDSTVEYGLTTSYGSSVSDPTMVTEHSIQLTGLTPSTTYHYRVKSTDGGGVESVSGDYTFTTLAAGQVPDAIIDNPAATLAGAWSTGTSAVDKYGDNYYFNGQGTGAEYATFTPNIPTSGDYDVYEWHCQGTNRTMAAPYVINYNGGQTTVNVNQQVNGGKWNLLGRFNFSAGTSHYVRITDAFPDGTQVVIADAVKLVYVSPPTPPAAPSNLTAAAASSSQINLSWTDNSDNESNFVVARATTAGGPYSDIATLGAGTTSYSDTGLAGSTTYYYVVRASNSAGSSANSNEASATTPAVPLYPAAPGNLVATAISGSQVNLSWTDNSDNETNFVVERAAASGGPFTVIATLGANASSYSDTGLTPRTWYYYRVKATNADGSSDYSNEASARTKNR